MICKLMVISLLLFTLMHHICTNCCNTVIFSVIDTARKKDVDDSGFSEDTRQTTEVVCLTCAAIRSLEDNDRHLWAI
jgi:hypothetical protein